MRKPVPFLALAALLASAAAYAGKPAPARGVGPERSDGCREADAAALRARQLLAKDDDEGALEAVEAAKKACADPSAESFVVHGEVLVRMKRWNDAVMQYHEALRRAPGNAEAANGLAGVFYVSRRYEQARAVLRNAEAAGAAVDAELKKAVEEKLARPK